MTSALKLGEDGLQPTRPCRRPVTNDLCRRIHDTASNRRRTRITVTADHGLPVGVATPRLLSSKAIALADRPSGRQT